jgi:hypothetical protein
MGIRLVIMKKHTLQTVYNLIGGMCMYTTICIYLFKFEHNGALLLKGLVVSIVLEFLFKKIFKNN